jgi:DNA-binding winged helix-turn-helix (wHTH) protein
MSEDQAQARVQIEFGPFCFDKRLGKLSKGGTAIKLGGMPLKILQYLVERPGEAVSRVELQKLLWNGAAYGDFEQGLSSAVNVVRRTLNDSADQPRYIETIPGQGYRFIAPLRELAGIREMTNAIGAPDGAETPGKNSQEPTRWRLTENTRRLGIAGVVLFVAVGAFAYWKVQSKPLSLVDGSQASLNQEANDQYNLAMSFLAFQNDIPLARKTFQRAVELDPHFASARLQHASMQILEIFNGYSNDESVLYRVEEEVHQIEKGLPATDGLLVGVQLVLSLAQGRLDRISAAKVEDWWREGANEGRGPPVYVIIFRMLRGQTEEPMEIARKRLETYPLENPTRMLLGELLRTRGDAPGAIQTLERVLQQSPNHMTPAWFLTMAYLDHGKADQARSLLTGMRRDFEKNYAWRHAWAMLLASEGNREDALRFMDEETLKFARLTWTVTSSTADFYALLGEHSKAIEWLQLAIGRGDERVEYFRRNPRLQSLREDPRFQSTLKSVQARRR